MTWHGRFIDKDEVRSHIFANYTRYTWELLQGGELVLIKPLLCKKNALEDVFKDGKKIGTKTIRGKRYFEQPNNRHFRQHHQFLNA